MKFNFENFNKKGKSLVAGLLLSSASLAGVENSNKDKIEKDNTNEANKFEYSISSHSKTGKLEFKDLNAKENIKKEIAKFLQNVDLNKYSIEITGKYSIERPYARNDELKEERKNLGEKLVNEVLSEKFSPEEIKKIKIESSAIGQSIYDLGFSEEDIQKLNIEEKEKLIDQTQGIDIKLKKISTDKVFENLSKNDFEKENDFDKVFGVVLDQSQSMKNDADMVNNLIENINKTRIEKVKSFKVEGGNIEKHLSTLSKILDNTIKFKEEKILLLVTDEPDQNFQKDSYKIEIEKILEKAKEKNVLIVLKAFNPDPKIGGSKIVKLDKDSLDLLYMPEVDKSKSYNQNIRDSRVKQWYDNM